MLAAMIVRLCLTFFVFHGLSLAPVSAQTKTLPRTALVIGNAKYEPSVGALRNPVHDAKAVAKTLRGLGFSVIEEHNVTRDELLKAVGKFRSKLTGTEVALFYYAGHGISVAGSNYLLPVKSGYSPEGADEATLRLLAETKLFNAEQVVAEMSAAGARCNLVILDACRNTPVARNPRSRNAATRGGLAEMKPPAGSLIAFATDAGHIAQDGEDANGLYTGELLKHLRIPGLTIEQVFKRTRAAVMERSDGGQIPAEYSRLIGEDIYLAGLAPMQPAPPPAAVPDTAMKALPVKAPTTVEITKLASAGKAAECIAALKLATATRGAGDFVVTPLDTLLERAKEDLKGLTTPSPKVGSAMEICELVLVGIEECLPREHPQRSALTAKAQNRRGDCLLILGKPEEALVAYNIAIPLAANDSYPVFNRGRAHLALGHTAEAKADFTTASSPKFNQPKARKLALEALAELP
jgi:tetratricopeptide (TPR) repeat protein